MRWRSTWPLRNRSVTGNLWWSPSQHVTPRSPSMATVVPLAGRGLNDPLAGHARYIDVPVEHADYTLLRLASDELVRLMRSK